MIGSFKIWDMSLLMLVMLTSSGMVVMKEFITSVKEWDLTSSRNTSEVRLLFSLDR